MGLIIVLGSELRSCVKVEVDVLGSPVPNKPTVSVDAKQHFNKQGGNVSTLALGRHGRVTVVW